MYYFYACISWKTFRLIPAFDNSYLCLEGSFDDSMQIGPQDSQSKWRETIKKDTEVIQIETP